MNRSSFPYFLLILAFFTLLGSCNKDDGVKPSVADSLDISVLADSFARLDGGDTTLIQVDANGIYSYPITLNLTGKTQASGQILSLYYIEYAIGGSDTIRDLNESNSNNTPLRVRTGASAIYPVGLDLALSQMNEGDEFAFLIPSELGYGDIVFPPGFASLIPSNATLYFRVRLVLIENESEILTQEQTAINQFIIDGELNDTSVVPVDFVERFANGMIFKRLTQDTLRPFPFIGDSVAVEYTAMSLDSTITYDTKPAANPFRYEFGVSETIPGFDQGIGNMRLGEQALFVLPSSVAYGPSAQVFPDYIKQEIFELKIIPEYVLSVKPYQVMVFRARILEIY